MATTFDLYWAPEGRKIATVEAETVRLAIRKAPKPYRKYLGEIWAWEVKNKIAEVCSLDADCSRHSNHL